MPLFDSTSRIRLNASTIFNSIWDSERICKRKLGFYSSVKHQFELELYLKVTSYRLCKRTAQLRTSADQLGIEKGRHGKLALSQHHRACKFCSTEDQDVLRNMLEMPFADLIIEDELHVLHGMCPAYHALRYLLPDDRRNLQDRIPVSVSNWIP